MSWGGYTDAELEPVALALATAQGEPHEHRRYFYLASQVMPALNDLAPLAEPKGQSPSWRHGYATGVNASRAGVTDPEVPDA